MNTLDPELVRIREGRLPERTEMEMLRGRQIVTVTEDTYPKIAHMAPSHMTVEWKAQRFAAVLRRSFNTEIEVVPHGVMLMLWAPGNGGTPISFAPEHVDVFPSDTLLAQLALLFK